MVSLEQELPSHWIVTVSGLVSLGRRLPISIDTNLERARDGNGNPSTITYDVEDALGAGPILKRRHGLSSPRRAPVSMPS